MQAPLTWRTVYVDGESLELCSPTSVDFSCQPDDIRRYIEGERWDLVFNALCYLTGTVEEGAA
jgi:hypothetical protein